MTTIITISNQKGGIAKTTTAAHLAHGLAQRNKNVLMVDFDVQANLTILFKAPRSAAASYLVTMGLGAEETGFIQKMVKQVREHLWLIPSDKSLSGAQAQITADQRNIDWIRQVLNRFVARDLQYIIIDTNPAVGGILERSVWAADLLIVPTELAALSLVGVSDTVEMATSLRDQKGWEGGLLGILPTMRQGDIGGGRSMLREHRASLEELTATFGDLILPSIPQRAALRECASRGQTIFEFDPDNDAAKAYRQLVEIVLKAT